MRESRVSISPDTALFPSPSSLPSRALCTPAGGGIAIFTRIIRELEHPNRRNANNLKASLGHRFANAASELFMSVDRCFINDLQHQRRHLIGGFARACLMEKEIENILYR